MKIFDCTYNYSLNVFQLGHDVRQAFLEGCDIFIDKTLQGSLKTVEECELRLQGFSDMLDDSDVSLINFR